MNPVMKGIMLVIVDSFFFSLMSLFVRESGDLPVFEKAFFRNLVASAAALITLARSEEKFHIKKGSMPDLWKRAIFGGTGLLLNFYAIDHIPLADANILNKMSPFFAIVVSIFVLKEVPTFKEILAVIIAFCGAVLVVKPGMGASWYALAGLAGGAGAGIAYTYVRRLGQHGERGPVIVAFFSIFTCAACLPFMIMTFVPLTLRQFIYLMLAGCCAAIAQFAITAAYRYAPASQISVFDYSQVLFASLWGIMFFDEVPDGISLIGYALILSMAIYRWETARKKEKA
jgi:drug/metabolite transporter (DMT)-like permease